MLNLTIRPMIEQDIEALSQLYKQFRGEQSSVTKMNKTFQFIKSNPNYIILNALIDHTLVGSILGIVCHDLYGDSRPFLVIENFIVTKHYRHQGIGKSLLSEMEKLAKEKDCNQVILITDADRKDSIWFYESAGYNPNTHQGFKKTLN